MKANLSRRNLLARVTLEYLHTIEKLGHKIKTLTQILNSMKNRMEHVLKSSLRLRRTNEV
jgi:hypothetical protein